MPEKSQKNQKSLQHQIVAATGIVMASVLASRFLGFFREWTVAHQVGSNATTDAYYAAFTLPDFLNYLVAGGALSLTFIPVFTKYIAEGREEEGWEVFSTVATFMGLVLIVLVIAAEIYAHDLVSVIAPGFHGSQRALLVFLTRVMLPAQICFYVGGILAAVQYARGQFLVPSMAPIVYNTAIILGGFFLAPRIGIAGFAVGVVVGALAGNLLLQIYGARRAGARYRPRLDLRHPGFLLFLKLTVPIMLALSIPFTDDWIIRWFGSYLQPASITWLSYAKTLMRVPLGVVGQAIGVASFPVLAQLYSEKKYEELNRLLNHTLKAMLLLLIPIAALTIAQSSAIVHLVFSHTRLSEFDLEATARTLVFFSLGLTAWGAHSLLARGFYATRDTITPAVAGTVLTFLNLPLYWWLSHRMQYVGLALASSIGISIYTIALFVLLMRRTRNRQAGELTVFFLKVCAASAGMAIICYPAMRRIGHWNSWHTTLGAFLDLVIVTGIGFAVWMGLSRLFQLREVGQYIRELWAMVLRRRGRVGASGGDS
ncbi:MAG TPA: murein biosynthesis integral membrane protein MurJ [Candidatus Dormibacteraeota bacterium]|nr:murein biosynthesis integral membrane protein MurJ [Candidatus Dormibacteraeota bacterium]